MDPPPTTTATKRGRDDLPEEEGEDLSKRFRTEADDIILKILDDVEDDAIEDQHPQSSGDLDSVVRSLQEEIGLSPPNPGPAAELGFLLEASDDQLGLPPTSPPSVAEEAASGAAGFWGLDGEISNCYDEFDVGLGFGVAGAVMKEEEGEGVVFQEGLFDDFGDVGFSVTSDLWRQEELPAL